MSDRYGGYNNIEALAEYYDYTYEDQRKHDVNFFVDYSRKASGRTLELGCGTGRVLIPAAIAGCGITGLDLSPYMLKRCQSRLSQQPDEVTWFRAVCSSWTSSIPTLPGWLPTPPTWRK